MVKRLSLVNYFLPDFGTLLGIAIFFGVLGLGPRMLNMDGDLGRHITIGRFILDTMTIPLVDHFSFTMTGEALVPHEWLAQVLFFTAYRVLGLDGVVLFCGLLIALTIYLVFTVSVKRSLGVSVPILLVILGAAASSLHWLARPHLFTMLYLALWMWLIDELRNGKNRAMWFMPAIMFLWVNTHGAFIAGFVCWVIYGAGYWIDRVSGRLTGAFPSMRKFEKRFLLGGFFSFLVSFINPAGVDTWKTSLGYLQSRYLVNHTQEYLPPDFQNPSTWPFLLFILISILFLGLKASKTQTSGLMLVVAWTAMGLVSARNIPLYVIVAVPVLTDIISGWLKEPHHWARKFSGMRIYDHLLAAMQRGMRGYVWLPAALVICGIYLSSGGKIDFLRQGNRFLPEVFPVEASRWIEKENSSSRMFNYFPWGGYLLYRFWPERLVFIDGQTDFYGESLTKKYEAVITAAPGWQDVLMAYQVDTILIPPDGSLDLALSSSKGWSRVYQDPTAVIWQRINLKK